MISVIIPIYNVERYIQNTIESVLHQTYEDFELILVDDGSTDNSGKICDEYGLKDCRIKVIHKKNGGVSSARNEGLRQFRGDFLTFIDADDYINPDYFQSVVALFDVHENVDVLIFAWNIIDEETNCKREYMLKTGGLITSNEYMEKSIFPNDQNGGGYPWNKFWKIKKREECVFFDESLWNYEDKLWILQMLNQCNVVWIENKAFYNYVYRKESLSHDPSRLMERTFNGIEAFKKISELDYSDVRLKNISYMGFCLVLNNRFFTALKKRNVEINRMIYDRYKTEWNRIFINVVKYGNLKARIKAIINFLMKYILR